MSHLGGRYTAGRSAGERRRCDRIGIWNVGGINSEEKRLQVVQKFKEGHLGILGLCETKLKGKGRDIWDGVKVIKSGVEDGVAREGVAMLLNEKWNSCLVSEKYVSSRIMYGKFKMGGVKLAVIVAYAPCGEEGKDEFWRSLRNEYDSISVDYKKLVVGDLNGWVGNTMIEGIVGKFGVPGQNINGRAIIDFC